MRYRVFSFASKKVQGFSSYKKIFGETFIMSLKSTSFPKPLISTLINAFYLLNKTIWKKSETQFCRRKTAEDNNAKIKVFPNIFKANAFLQIFFPRNLLFRQVLRTSVFLNSKCLKMMFLIKENKFFYCFFNWTEDVAIDELMN